MAREFEEDESEHEQKLGRAERAELRRASARLAHETEQTEAGLESCGRVLAGLWRGLNEGGVPEKCATEIVCAYVHSSLTPPEPDA
jgi:hypothetical protein